ncbi:MAG: hypothetical protein ACJA0G_001252 [Kangiellaceae bacterium]|jgi:hypothetical protein
METNMYSLSTSKKMFATAVLIASISVTAATNDNAIDSQLTPTTQAIEAPLAPSSIRPTDEVFSESLIEPTAAPVAASMKAPLIKAESNSLAADTQTCPDYFYQIKLPNNGKLCQVFAAELPASMIFFVPQPPSEVIEFYQQHNPTFSTTKQVKDRFLMQTTDKNTTLIISSDGQGTQVDILVKKADY